jgi:NADPH:quinone reductase-like Zn-dependent oxidoreductase
MRAMVLRRVCQALAAEDRPIPTPGPGQVLVCWGKVARALRVT